MKRMRFPAVATAIVFTFVFLLFQNFSELKIDPDKYQYQLVELKHLSAKTHSLAYGINSKGEAFGQSMDENGLWHAVMWSPNGDVKDLGRLDLESQNQLHENLNFSPKGVRIGSPKTLESCNGECALKRDLLMEVQLGYEKTKRHQTGFLKMKGKAKTQISPLAEGMDIYPKSINSKSHVVGWASFDQRKSGRAFLWKNGKTINLGAAKGGHSSANDINGLGQIVGETLDQDKNLRPVLWSVVGDRVSALDLSQTTPQYQGRANAINDGGVVVGQIRSANQAHPFRWTADTGIQDLNSMVRESDPLNFNREWILEDSRGINNCGQIITWGRKAKGSGSYSLMLKPLHSEPGC